MFEENDFYINVVKFGKSPLNIEERKIKAPRVKTRKQYKLAFSSNKNFQVAEESKVVEAYLHNDHKRCTFLFRNLGTFTF